MGLHSGYLNQGETVDTYKEASKAQLGTGLDRTCEVETDSQGIHIKWEDGTVTTFTDPKGGLEFLANNHFTKE